MTEIKFTNGFTYLFHGTHKDHVPSFRKNGLMANQSRTNKERGVAFLSPRADVAFAYAVMGGEYTYLRPGSKRPKDVPMEDRALIVFKIPESWYNKNVQREVLGALPEVSFKTGVPAKFVDKIIVGDRSKVLQMNKLNEEVAANAVSGGGIDFNKNGRNKYSVHRMSKRNCGLESFARWMKSVEEAKKLNEETTSRYSNKSLEELAKIKAVVPVQVKGVKIELIVKRRLLKIRKGVPGKPVYDLFLQGGGKKQPVSRTNSGSEILKDVITRINKVYPRNTIEEI